MVIKDKIIKQTYLLTQHVNKTLISLKRRLCTKRLKTSEIHFKQHRTRLQSGVFTKRKVIIQTVLGYKSVKQH